MDARTDGVMTRQNYHRRQQNGVDSDVIRRGRRNKYAYKVGFAHEKALIYGVVQCLAGIAYLVLGVVSVASRAWGYYYGCGMWCGVLSLTAGVTGLAASRCKSNKTIVTFMVLSVLSATAALITISIASVGIIADHSLFNELDMSSYSSALVVHSLTIVISVVASFCGAMAAIVGCRGVCAGWYGAEDSVVSDQDVEPQVVDPGFLPATFMDSHHMDSSQIYSHDGLMHNGLNMPLMGVAAPAYQPQLSLPGLGGTNTGDGALDPGGSRMIIMQSTGPGVGPGAQPVSQFMYILQAGAPCPQPGQAPAASGENEAGDHSYSSPPPSYSTLALDLLSRSGDQSALETDPSNGNNSHSNSDHDNSTDTPPSNFNTHDFGCQGNVAHMILQDLWRQRVCSSSLSNEELNNSDTPNNRLGNRIRNLSTTSDQRNSRVSHTEESECLQENDSLEIQERETSFSSDWSHSSRPGARAAEWRNSSLRSSGTEGATATDWHNSPHISTGTSIGVTPGNRHNSSRRVSTGTGSISLSEQELPLLEASPQRYGLRRHPSASSNHSNTSHHSNGQSNHHRSHAYHRFSTDI